MREPPLEIERISSLALGSSIFQHDGVVQTLKSQRQVRSGVAFLKESTSNPGEPQGLVGSAATVERIEMVRDPMVLVRELCDESRVSL